MFLENNNNNGNPTQNLTSYTYRTPDLKVILSFLDKFRFCVTSTPESFGKHFELSIEDVSFSKEGRKSLQMLFEEIDDFRTVVNIANQLNAYIKKSILTCIEEYKVSNATQLAIGATDGKFLKWEDLETQFLQEVRQKASFINEILSFIVFYFSLEGPDFEDAPAKIEAFLQRIDFADDDQKKELFLLKSFYIEKSKSIREEVENYRKLLSNGKNEDCSTNLFDKISQLLEMFFLEKSNLEKDAKSKMRDPKLAAIMIKFSKLYINKNKIGPNESKEIKSDIRNTFPG